MIDARRLRRPDRGRDPQPRDLGPAARGADADHGRALRAMRPLARAVRRADREARAAARRPCARSPSTAWAARRPISCSGTVTVVSPTKCAGRVSSMPVIETSPGTSTPASRRRISTPIAASSLAATTASGSAAARQQQSRRRRSRPRRRSRRGCGRCRPRAAKPVEALRARVQAGRALDERDRDRGRGSRT